MAKNYHFERFYICPICRRDILYIDTKQEAETLILEHIDNIVYKTIGDKNLTEHSI